MEHAVDKTGLQKTIDDLEKSNVVLHLIKLATDLEKTDMCCKIRNATKLHPLKIVSKQIFSEGKVYYRYEAYRTDDTDKESEIISSFNTAKLDINIIEKWVDNLLIPRITKT